MTSLNQISQDTLLSIQGCGYSIENDRVIIAIEYIRNNRSEDSISGTLRLQLCALSQSMGVLTNEVLASTIIGEIKGQHFIPDCHYDLVFQPPSIGTWQLVLQLSEWDGKDYELSDTVYFEMPYHVADIVESISIEHATPSTQKMAFENTDTHTETNLLPTPQASTSQTATPQTSKTTTQKKKEVIQGNDIDLTEGYLIINKTRAKKLLNVKGVPKKPLEKLIAERPFQSEKAVLSVKGIGPSMLKKILADLAE